MLPSLPDRRKVALALCLLAGVLAAGTFTLNLWRYQTYRAAWPFDLAFFNHQLWSIWDGMEPLTLRPVNYFSMEGPEPWRMAQMRLLTLPLALIYPVCPGVPLLLGVQSLVVAAGVWPMYRIAVRRSDEALWGLLAAAFYALAAPLWLLATMDFRHITLAIPLVLLAFDALEARGGRRFAATTLLALCARHLVAVVIAALTLSRSLRRGESWAKRCRWVAGPLALCVAWMAIFQLYLSAMFGPHAAGLYRKGMFEPGLIGAGQREPAAAIVFREWPELLKYELPLVAAGLAAPELVGVGLLLQYPPLRLGQWSLHPGDHFARYTAPSTMVLLAAVAVSLGRIGRFLRNGTNPARRRGIGAYTVLCGLGLAVSTAWLVADVVALPSRVSEPDRRMLARVASEIEPGDGVMGFFEILPQFSTRARIFEYHQLPGFRPGEPIPQAALHRALEQSDWCIVQRTGNPVRDVVRRSGRFELSATGSEIKVYRRTDSRGPP